MFAHEYAHDLGLPGPLRHQRWRERHRVLDADELRLVAGPRQGHHRHHARTTWAPGRSCSSAGSTTRRPRRAESTHKLGPSYHATKKAQAVVVELPKDAHGKDRYYIAENRQYVGYDGTLPEGPYNFGWTATQPDRVEHFPYQNGLLDQLLEHRGEQQQHAGRTPAPAWSCRSTRIRRR